MASTPPPPTSPIIQPREPEGPDPGIVEFFEHCLTAAKEGRVLFVAGAVGIVQAQAARPRFDLESLRTIPATSGAGSISGSVGGVAGKAPLAATGTAGAALASGTDVAGPAPAKYDVAIGAFVGSRADGIEPRALASAMADVVRGAGMAEAAIAQDVTARCEAALPARERKS